jgi:signal transduction histidine kinase/CheY-like chemotaxis protein
VSEYASEELINATELALSSQVGRSSARILLNAIAETKPLGLKQLVELVEDASQTYQFNQEILQFSIQHIEQGISVVDRDLKLLAWNKRYIELFNYPENFIHAGMSLATLLNFNAQRGYFGDKGDIESQVEKRLEYIRRGSGYRYRRQQQDGRVVELKGNPMPGGGFVTTYTDITEYVNAQRQLEEAKETLEERVAERTSTLQQVNAQLHEAKITADKANQSKTKFLAAAGHDLMQPFNAASLFASMIEQAAKQNDVVQAAKGLNRSLQSAEDLLTSLLDMTKLETGLLTPQITHFNLREVTDSLIHESSLIAQEKGLKLDYVPADVWISSDIKLFKRIIQNLISNAIRYTHKGKVLLGCRRTHDTIQVHVIDTGLGIPEEQQALIFEEFMQLDQHEKEKGQGLGLGLTIVDRISRLLGHTVSVRSIPNKGTCFSITAKRHINIPSTTHIRVTKELDSQHFLMDVKVLIIDNDLQVLEATKHLMTNWGAVVFTAMDETQVLDENIPTPDLILADYHLNQGHTGVNAVKALYNTWQKTVPTILNSANYDEEIRQLAIDEGLTFLNKPLKSGTLKRAIKKALTK